MVSVLGKGWQTTSGIRRYIGFVYIVNLFMGIALAVVVGKAVAHSLGNSMAASKMVDSFDPLWFQAFSSQAQGLVKSFQPSVSGIGAILDGLDALVTGHPFKGFPGIWALGMAYLLLWGVFSAGAFGKMVKGQETTFWQAMGTYSARFLLLLSVAGICYYGIFAFLLPFFTTLVKQMTREVTDARIVYYYTVGKYLVVWFLALWVSLTVDFARVMTVAGNGRFVPLTFVRALLWVMRRPVKTFGLITIFLVMALVGMGIYAAIAPGATGGSLSIVLTTFLIGQLYLILRMMLRLWLWGSEVALWQSTSQ